MHNLKPKILVYLVGGSAILADRLKENTETEVFSINENNSEDFFLSVFEQVKSLNNENDHTHLIVIFRNDQFQHFGFLSGLLKTAEQENNKITGKTIGVDSIELSDLKLLSSLIVSESYTKDKEIRYRNGEREVKAYQKIDDVGEPVNSIIREGGVYLITGGSGGIGLIFADYISSFPKTTIILIGRSPLDDYKQERIEGIEGVSYIQVDINNRDAVKQLIKTIRSKHKKINGVIHSAGLLRDSLIRNKEEEEIKDVLRPKLQGVKNLDEATKDLKLDFLVLFSSVASIFGNIGQSDYAAANAFLDNYAQYRNRLKQKNERIGHTISINWSLWSEGGMHLSQEGQKYIQKQFGLGLLPTDQGIKAFEILLRNEIEQGVVAFGNGQEIHKKIFALTSETISLAENVQPSSSDTNIITKSDINYEKLVDTITQQIILKSSQLLKLDVSHIQIDKELGDYGFGSILLAKFANELSEYYDIDLMPTVFYNYPTIEKLVGHLMDVHIDQMLIKHPEEINNSEKVSIEISAPISTTPKRKKKVKYKNATDSFLTKRIDNESVAIIGVGGRLPNSNGLIDFWDKIKDNKDLISEVPLDRWDWKEYYGDPRKELNKTKAKWGGFIDDIDKFDPLFFSISPKEATLMDPQQRITLETVYAALEDSGMSRDRIKGTSTGVFIGASSHDYSCMVNNQKKLSGQAQSTTGSAHSILANRISYLLDIHGPSEPIDTACSSSLIAIHRAVENIRNGNCDMAIAGGVNAILTPDVTLSFSQTGMLSEDGRCKTFDQKANGYVRGEGVGIIILKGLKQAEIDGDQIYAVVRGTSENHGGKANTMTSPNPIAQKKLLLNAYRKAKVDPRDVSYIEAHGTGTPLGDPIEMEALKSAFKALYKDHNLVEENDPHCAIGSVKTNIGHLEAAAGIAGVLKVVFAMKHKILPGNPNLKEVNEFLKLDGSPFFLLTKTIPWETNNDKPRIAGISSFGFGGSNAHVILEEYHKEPEAIFETNDPAIIVLSAKNKERLVDQVKNLKAFILSHSFEEHEFRNIAYTLQKGRDAMEERFAVVAQNISELVSNLDAFINEERGDFFHGNILSNNSSFLLKGGAGKAFIDYAIENKEIVSLGQLWVNGVSIDWDLLYTHQKPMKISLPTYPFARERYWISEEKNTPSDMITKNISGNVEVPETIIDQKSTKQVIRQVLSETLSIPVEKIEDNIAFQSLGLDSILIHGMLQTLKSENIQVSASDILTHNTIEELTNHLQDQFRVNFIKEKGRMPTHVELLKKGNKSKPIFLIPGSPGMSSPYSDLAEFIDSNHTVYGLNWKGVMQGEMPFTTMEEIVQHNIDLIETISKGEAIQLVGHSYGGLIVYEMLKYYAEKQQEVSNVILIDSSPKILNTKYRESKKMKLFLKSISYNQFISDKEISEMCSQILKQSKAKRLIYLLKLLNKKSIINQGHNPLIERLYTTYYSALDIKYKSKKVQLPFKANVIKASIDTVINDKSQEQSWDGYFSEVEAKSVEGDHFSLVKDPQNIKWIERIKFN